MNDLTPILRRYIRPMSPIPTDVQPVLDKMRPFPAILFDVYGTLLISDAGEIGGHAHPRDRLSELSDLLNEYGIQRSPKTIDKALSAAIRSSHAAARKRGIDVPEVDIVQIWRDVTGSDDISSVVALALAHELIVNPIFPMPGAAELVTAASRAGTIVGIISNAQFYTPLILKWAFQTSSGEFGFDENCCFFSYREGHAKPSVFMFQKAGRRLAGMGIAKEKVLYVGNDMGNDILPASSVGFVTALFAGDDRSLRMRADNEQVAGTTPDLIVTDLRQLLAGIATS